MCKNKSILNVKPFNKIKPLLVHFTPVSSEIFLASSLYCTFLFFILAKLMLTLQNCLNACIQQGLRTSESNDEDSEKENISVRIQ